MQIHSHMDGNLSCKVGFLHELGCGKPGVCVDTNAHGKVPYSLIRMVFVKLLSSTFFIWELVSAR
jgi:hypothetical protein